MKHKSILFCLLFVLLFAVPWKATASSTHLMGTITIYVDEQKTIYRDSKYIPSNYYVSDDGWFIRQKTGNAWSDRQEFYDVKIISKNSQSCTILGLQSNYDAYGLTTTELHCKGTRQSIGEYEEMVWKIEVKSYGYLRVEASPAGGTVSTGSKVTLTAKSNGNTVSGCDIYYTLDGSTPTKSSTKYTSSGVTIDESCWLTAKAFKTGYESNHIDEWYYYVSPVIAEVNETNFPDENFRNWILAQDYGKDGKLTETEIKSIGHIDVSGTSDNPGSIENLKGIEYFTALTTLNCRFNQLTSLDVSKNTALTSLDCDKNKLTSLDVSKNTALTTLHCGENQLTSLEVSKNTALTDLWCNGNKLTSIDVSKNTALTGLRCYSNQLTSLDVSKNTALRYLYCYSNQLTSLDVSKNTALTTLSCGDNQLTSLDVSKNTELTRLYCHSNQLTSLDVSKNTALTVLNCSYNQLTSIDVSKNTALTTLYCSRNQIKGASMDALIQSLPTTSTNPTFWLIDNSEGDEGNECTKSQVAAAKAKGWTPLYYNGSKWMEYEGSEDPSPSIGSGTENDPFSPAAANEFASSLGADIPTEQVYYVKGKVASIKEQFGTQYGNATFYISDDGTTANQFYVYRAMYLGNKKYAGEDLKLNVGDEVVVCGKLVNYSGTLPETVHDEAYVVSINGTKGSTYERGDVNGDGVVNIADLMMLVNILTGK